MYALMDSSLMETTCVQLLLAIKESTMISVMTSVMIALLSVNLALMDRIVKSVRLATN